MKNDLLRIAPAPTGDLADFFLERNELIRCKVLESFVQPAWPKNVDINGATTPQSEMQTWVVAGEETGLT